MGRLAARSMKKRLEVERTSFCCRRRPTHLAAAPECTARAGPARLASAMRHAGHSTRPECRRQRHAAQVHVRARALESLSTARCRHACTTRAVVRLLQMVEKLSSGIDDTPKPSHTTPVGGEQPKDMRRGQIRPIYSRDSYMYRTCPPTYELCVQAVCTAFSFTVMFTVISLDTRQRHPQPYSLKWPVCSSSHGTIIDLHKRRMSASCSSTHSPSERRLSSGSSSSECREPRSPPREGEDTTSARRSPRPFPWAKSVNACQAHNTTAAVRRLR